MFIVRDIFNLQFGKYKDAKALFDEAKNKKMLPDTNSLRLLTDFTGDSYRMIMELSFDTLSDYEKSMTSSLNEEEWKKWYERFKPLVRTSSREILKQVG